MKLATWLKQLSQARGSWNLLLILVAVQAFIQERKRTGVMLGAMQQHKPLIISHRKRPPPVHSPCPLSRFHGRDRCQLSGWWLRTGHPVSHFALLAIYVVKSSMAPVEHLTNAFLDWLQSSGRSLGLQLKPSMCKLKNVLTRVEVMGRLKRPSKITFSLAVIMALSKAAFMSSQTNYSAGNTYTQRAAITQSVLPWKD